MGNLLPENVPSWARVRPVGAMRGEDGPPYTLGAAGPSWGLLRAGIAYKLIPMYEAEAKKRQGTRTDLTRHFVADLPQSVPPTVRTTETSPPSQIAPKIAGRERVVADRSATTHHPLTPARRRDARDHQPSS